MLEQLLGAEVAARRERYLSTRTRMAHMPFQRTLDQFDFAFRPSIDERQVKELANLAFVTEATNILLLGPPRVGKSHLAIALALRAIENGYGLFRARLRPNENLRKTRAEHNLDRRMRVYLSPKVLVVDEFGIWPYDGSRPPPSSPWYRPGTSGAASSSLPTRASASGANCSATPSSPRRYWTGCCTTAMCSTSGGRASGSGRNARRGSSRRNSISPLRRRRPATTTRTDKVADQNRVGQF